MTDRDVLAATIWGEARGEPTAGRLAVASVIRNRLLAQRWGTTYRAVCLAPKQFSCWNVGDPNAPLLRRIFDSENRVEALRDPIVRECYWIADGVLGDCLLPQVRDAQHYYATWLAHPPTWAKTGRVVATIGQHVFLEGVA